MHHVDVEFKNGNRIAPQFATQGEAVAYAGRMAQDSAVMRSEVRGLDALARDGGPGSGPQEGGGKKGPIKTPQLKAKGSQVEADLPSGKVKATLIDTVYEGMSTARIDIGGGKIRTIPVKRLAL